MQRIRGRAWAFVPVLAFALTGCDSGGGGDVGSGMPKEQGYVPISAMPGAPNTDMTKIGNKPAATKKAPAKAAAPEPAPSEPDK